jgi:flagellar biosynthesis component FlhA
MGDESQLSPLLGLETVDPILGLPAKWIARSQLDLARSAQVHLFDGPGLVAAHTLHIMGEIWHRALGFLEIQRWLLGAFPGHSPLLAGVIPAQTGLLLRTVKELIAEGLWLPHPAAFLELFVATLPELEPNEPIDVDMLKELMRKEIVPLNLERFTDSHGMLHAVEWRGEPDGDSADQTRLVHRLGAALLLAHEYDGSPVVLTDFENRLQLSQALRSPFPYLPVLSWAELPAHARLNLVAVVDARFEVDPSPWAQATFEVSVTER